MSYSVELWTYSKKNNSTAHPTIGTGTSITCSIRDGSGILAPVVVVSFTPPSNPSAYNYAYISEYSRFYYVRDWNYRNGLWACTMQVDPLASWKTNIGSHTLYISRSASAMNGRVVDTSYPRIAGCTKSAYVNVNNPFNASISTGVFIVGIINNDSGAIGAVSYYIFTNAQFKSFCGYLLGNTSWFGSPSDISTQLAKMLVNPFQYVVSCTWLPSSPQNGGTNVPSIPFGWWSAPVSAQKMNPDASWTDSITINVPKHPDALTRGYYLLTDDYSSYYLIVPPFGAVNLSANDLVDVDVITLDYQVDPVTGMGRCYVMNDALSPDVLTVLHGQAGVPVQLANTAPDVQGLVQQMLPGDTTSSTTAGATSVFEMSGLTAGFMAQNLVDSGLPYGTSQLEKDLVPAVENTGGQVKQFLSGIATCYLNKLYPMQSTGSNGGFAGGWEYVRLIGTFAKLANDDTANRGKPLCESRQINTLSGYFQVAEPNFYIPCTLTELQQISTAAAAGMFWE